jgi:fucose permease
VLTGAAFLVGGALLLLSAPLWPLLLCGAAAAGIGMGLLNVALTAAAARRPTPARALLVLTSAFCLGAVAGPTITAVGGSYEVALVAIVAIAIPSGLTTARRDGHGGVPTAATASIFSRPARWIAAIAALYLAAESVMASWGPTALIEGGTGSEEATVWLAAFWAGLASSRLLISWVDPAVSPVALVVGGLAVAVPLTAFSASAAAFVLVGVAFGPVFPGLFTWLAQLTPVRSSEMGLIFAVGLVGGVAGPALVGVLVDAGGRDWIGPAAAVFVLSALLAAAALGRALAISRP